MKRKKILDTLKNAEKSLSVEELSNKTDISVPSLRIDLYRLQEEGEIESREREGELRWKIKVSEPIEEKYEKMSERHAP